MVEGSQNFSGHGLSFVVSPTMDFNEATATSYLGLFNISNIGRASNHIFAVEFDTVVSPEFNDLNGEHVGIDVNSLISNDSAFVTYFDDKEEKNISLSLVSGNLTQVWIEYDGVQRLLNVTVAPISVPKPTRPLLSMFIDLSQIFLESMYIGLAAATGTIANNHYVLGWSFNRSGAAEILDVSKLPSLPPPALSSLSPPALSSRSPPALFLKQSNKGGQIPTSIIIVSVVASIVVLITIVGAVYIVRKKKYEEVYEDWEEEYGPHRFSYKTLYKATRGWKEKEVIGEGGFGKVYRGVLSSSDHIAIKRVSHESGEQALKQFVAEIASL